MRNRYLHEDEDRHSLTDKILFGVALVGLSAMAAQYAGCFSALNPKTDRNAVPKDNIIYVDNDGDGDLDSAVRSKSGVLFEIKYDNNGNPYIEHKALAFEVDPAKPYHEQKEAALSARSR